jgi:hypothetical protein
MKSISLIRTAALALAMPSAAHAQLPRTMSPASDTSATALQGLLEDWDRIGFQPPSKPAQYRVYGRDGYVTSGPEYNFMASLIRSAVADSRAGRDQDTLMKIAAGRNLLAQQRDGNSSASTALTSR